MIPGKQIIDHSIPLTKLIGAIVGTLRTTNDVSLTAGQTSVVVPAYTINQGLIDLFYNGSRLSKTQFTETDSTHVTLADAALQTGDLLTYVIYDYVSSGVSEELAIAYAIVL